MAVALTLMVLAMVSHVAVTLGLNHAVLPPGIRSSERFRYLGVALAALASVAAVDASFVFLSRKGRRESSPRLPARRMQLPAQLRFQRVPMRVVLLTAAASSALAAGTLLMAWPLYAVALAALLPWVPPFLFEEIWKYKHYGFLSIFLVIAVLQLGHLGEHAAQLSQLIIYGGDLSRAHGVFGALDFEDVHFAWDTAAWLGAGMLVYRFRSNRWLWISFAFASAHEVEHLYLFALVKLDLSFYLRGGFAGIMGQGGLVGSPLGRPYLHFLYNYLVVGAMLLGLWDQAHHVYDRYVKQALPDLTPEQLVKASGCVHRVAVDRGVVVVHQGDSVDWFFIVSKGSMEVVRETRSGGRSAVSLGPGQSLAELGLIRPERNAATVRAAEDCELLMMERQAFEQIVLGSVGTRTHPRPDSNKTTLHPGASRQRRYGHFCRPTAANNTRRRPSTAERYQPAQAALDEVQP
jgi:hypothetical protein